MFSAKDLIMNTQPKDEIRLGTIKGKWSGYANYIVQFDGETAPSQKKYGYIGKSTTFSTNDRVMLLKRAGTYVIIGAIGGTDFK